MDPTEFDLTTAAIRLADNRRAAVANMRYSPWRLGTYITVAIGAPIAAGAACWLVIWWLGVLVAILILPASGLVVWWAVGAFMVEHQRLSSERQMLRTGQAVPVRPIEVPAVELRPGFPIDGVMTMAVEPIRAEAMALRNDCLAFIRAGMRRGGWSRSAIAEGPQKLISPSSWDRASKELQRLGYFKPGGAGLEPARDLGDSIKRLEAAR